MITATTTTTMELNRQQSRYEKGNHGETLDANGDNEYGDDKWQRGPAKTNTDMMTTMMTTTASRMNTGSFILY